MFITGLVHKIGAGTSDVHFAKDTPTGSGIDFCTSERTAGSRECGTEKLLLFHGFSGFLISTGKENQLGGHSSAIHTP